MNYGFVKKIAIIYKYSDFLKQIKYTTYYKILSYLCEGRFKQHLSNIETIYQQQGAAAPC